MSDDKRAACPLTYSIILRAGDGTEWVWRIKDNYFARRMKKIQREMLEEIRDFDLSHEFKLQTDNGFTTCRFCNVTSGPGKSYHRVGCTRPR